MLGNRGMHTGTKAILKVILTKVNDLLKVYSSLSGMYKRSSKKEKYKKNIAHLRMVKKELEGHISSGDPIFPNELKDIQSALLKAQKGISEVLDEAVQNKALQLRLSTIEKEVGVSLSDLNKKVVNSTKLLKSVAKEEGISGFHIPKSVKSTATTAGKFLLHSIAGPFAPIIHMASVGMHKAYSAGKALIDKQAQKRLAKSLEAEKMHPIFRRSAGEYAMEKMFGIPGKPSFERFGRNASADERYYARGYAASGVAGLSMKTLFNFFDKKAFKARWTRMIYLLLKKLAKQRIMASSAKGGSFLEGVGFAGIMERLPTIGATLVKFGSFLAILAAAFAGWKIGEWIRSVTKIDKWLSGDNGLFTKMAKGFYRLKDKVFPKIGKFFKSVGWFLKQLLLLGTPIGMLIKLGHKVAKFFHIRMPSEKSEQAGKPVIESTKPTESQVPTIQVPTSIKSRESETLSRIKSGAEKLKTATVQMSSAYKDEVSIVLKDLKGVIAGLPEKLKSQVAIAGGMMPGKIYNSNDPLTEFFAFGMAKEDD